MKPLAAIIDDFDAIAGALGAAAPSDRLSATERMAVERQAASRSLRRLYEQHGRGETYLSPHEVADAYRSLLPGAVVTHHLDWRYSLVWNRPVAS